MEPSVSLGSSSSSGPGIPLSGIHNDTPPAPQDGQTVALQVDDKGNLLVNVAVNSAGGGSNVNLVQVGGAPISLGPAPAASSLPVVLTAAQIATLTPLSTVAVSNFPATQPVSGTVAVSNFPATVAVTQSTSPWVVSGTVTVTSGTLVVTQPTGTNLHVVVDSAPTTAVTNAGTFATQSSITTLGQALAAASVPVVLTAAQLATLTPLTTVAVTQGTSPWVVSGTVTITPSGLQNVNVTQWNTVALGSPSAYGTSPGAVNVIGVNAFITNTPAVTLASTMITGNVTVVQPTGTNLHVVIDSGSSISAAVTGTTTDGTTTETPFLVIGGESNDATAQYQPLPLGAGGRSVIVEGIAGGTAIPISGAISFTAPQHVIIDSGTITTVSTVTAVTAITNALPAGSNVIGHVITDTGSVTNATLSAETTKVIGTVNQGTSPWVVSGAVTTSGTATVIGTLTNNNAAPAATNVGALVARANAAAPSWTEGDQVLLSEDLTGNLRVITEAGSTTAVTGNVTVVQPTGTNLHVVVDSGTLTTVSTVTAVTAITNALPTGANTIGRVDILGNAGAIMDGVNTAATAPANGLLGLGIFNTVKPTLTTGQSAGIQVNASGETIAAIVGNDGGILDTAKGTQSATAVGVQELKDAGRVPITLYVDAIVGLTTEALVTMNITKGLVTTTGTSYTVTTGKTFRIQSISITLLNTSTAVITSAKFRVRAAASSFTVTSPIIILFDVTPPSATALSGAQQSISQDFPDGLELASTNIIGMSRITSATTCAFTVCLVGYEY